MTIGGISGDYKGGNGNLDGMRRMSLTVVYRIRTNVKRKCCYTSENGRLDDWKARFVRTLQQQERRDKNMTVIAFLLAFLAGLIAVYVFQVKKAPWGLIMAYWTVVTAYWFLRGVLD